MTAEEMKALKVGDLVKIKGSPRCMAFLVTGNYGGRITAVKTVDLTNPKEWDIVQTPDTDMVEALRVLANEVNCRHEHGAEGVEHLKYIDDKLREIIS